MDEGLLELDAPPDKESLIGPLAHSLKETSARVRLKEGTLARKIYGRRQTEERFNCGYGLNEAFRDRLTAAGLVVSGVDEQGRARLIELPGRTFYLLTLFMPQLRSEPGRPHPLLSAFIRAAARG